MKHHYIPNPIDTSHVELPNELQSIVEEISHQIHEIWAQHRIENGWTYGEKRDDRLKQTPCLVPYENLSEEEKSFDRATALATIEYILSQGFEIRKLQ